MDKTEGTSLRKSREFRRYAHGEITMDELVENITAIGGHEPPTSVFDKIKKAILK